MPRLQLSDGTYEYTRSVEDLKNLITNRLGSDVGYEIQELIEQADYTSRKVETDLDSYESSLESWNCAGNDILDIIDNLKSYISDAKKIDRDKLLSSLERIEREINNIM